MRRSRLHRCLRTAIPLLTGIGYLVAAALPCPPDPVASAAAAATRELHGHHEPAASHEHSDAPDAVASLTAPCTCGCEEPGRSAGTGERLGPALLSASAALLPRSAASLPPASPLLPAEVSQPVDPPIPIAA